MVIELVVFAIFEVQNNGIGHSLSLIMLVGCQG